MGGRSGPPSASDDAVLDLGIGTGNLAARLPPCGRLVGVDVSERMLELAEASSGPRSSWCRPTCSRSSRDRADGASDAGPDRFDVIVSTYAIHHLTADEKVALIGAAARRLAPGGRLVVGDLMVASRATVPGMRARLAHPDVDDLFADEFPGTSTRPSPRWPAPGSRPWPSSSSATCRGGWRPAARVTSDALQHGQRVAGQGVQHVAALVDEHRRTVQLADPAARGREAVSVDLRAGCSGPRRQRPPRARRPPRRVSKRVDELRPARRAHRASRASPVPGGSGTLRFVPDASTSSA